MPPGVRSQGRGIEVIWETAGGGLNPLRGPSAALAALINGTAEGRVRKGNGVAA